MKRHHLAIALLMAAAIPAARVGADDSASEPAPEIHQVSGAIFRSRQPDLGQMPRLAARGIRTVVSLRSNDEVADEGAAARAAGLNFIQIGLPSLGQPDPESIRAVLAAITAADNQPVLVHCKRGADRTGVVVACYRIEYEGWTAEAALAEAKQFGFGWWQHGMKKFIRAGCGTAKP